MCPLKVCTVCGKPSERVVDAQSFADGVPSDGKTMGRSSRPESRTMDDVERTRATFSRTSTTLGWTDCGCSTDGTHWRTGVVLDPFAGSGTTLEAAQIVGRHAIGFDIDDRNADLARQRCGMFLEVVA
jgi:tRNA G10  N-methylase Trm11